jgi:hypothetical protein
MKRAVRLVCVHMRSTVLSAWFAVPQSCVTYSRAPVPVWST